MNRYLIIPLCCLLLWSSGSLAQSQFVRFVAGDQQWQGELQTAITSYSNQDGVELDLVAAIHIGDADYYHQLNQYFRTRDAVLYELVAEPDARPTADTSVGGSPVTMLQLALANFLNVSFQLREVDYLAENFRHADLSPEQLREIMLSKNENFFSMFLSLAVAELATEQAAIAGGADSSSLSMLSLLNALMAEDRATALKYLFAEELARSSGLLIGPALEQQLTILGDRNQAALAVLRESLQDRSKGRISLFYGAAHMPGFERELLASMGFEQVSQRWLTAWQIP